MTPPAHDPPAGTATGDDFPLSRPVKQKIKDGLVAAAMANLCFVRPVSRLLFEGNRYFDNRLTRPVEYLALAANILGLTFLIWAGIGLWRRVKSKVLLLVLDLLFLSLLVFPADFVRSEVLGYSDSQFAAFLRQPAVLICCLVVLILVLLQHRRVARAVAMTVVVAFPPALLVLGKIVLLGCHLVEIKACPISVPSPPLQAVQPGRPRVVWIIFDETDYRLAFEKRPPGVNLPEFDRLRQVALSADHAYAPADMTVISMPALISGRRVAGTSRHGCDLALEWDDTHTTNDWTTVPSVFSRARELGFNTALVGWFVPYGRLLGSSLNYCAWYGMRTYQLAAPMTFGGALLHQISSLAWPFYNRRVYISICQRSLRDALPVAADSKYGLVLLHMPPPHFPGVYLADKKEFTCLGIRRPWSYLNNLALADRMLGELRRAMEASGEWDKSWLIVSADHSWRTSQSYDGVRDYRVPFLVKLPGASQGATYSKQFNTLLTHDLILAILGGQLTGSAGLSSWLDQHTSTNMPVKTPYGAVEF